MSAVQESASRTNQCWPGDQSETVVVQHWTTKGWQEGHTALPDQHKHAWLEPLV